MQVRLNAKWWVMRLSGAVRDELERCVRENMPLEHVHAHRFSADQAALRGLFIAHGRLERGRLEAADLKNACLNDCDLTDLVLHHARLDGAGLSDLRIQRSDLSDASLESSQLRNCRLEEVRLANADLERALIADVRFVACELRDAVLRQAILLSTTFTDPGLKAVSLRGVDLSGSCLIDVDLRHADLCGASFAGALLCRIDLRGARLDDVRWEGATLVQVRTGSEAEAAGMPAQAVQPGSAPVDAEDIAHPGWIDAPAEAAVWRFLEAAPPELAARLALELCRRLRLSPVALETATQEAASPESEVGERSDPSSGVLVQRRANTALEPRRHPARLVGPGFVPRAFACSSPAFRTQVGRA